jgi:galactose mutarotase-like enzyme
MIHGFRKQRDWSVIPRRPGEEFHHRLNRQTRGYLSTFSSSNTIRYNGQPRFLPIGPSETIH